MSHHRIIKKYPNRRLYDTSSSTYITLDDIKKLILGYVPIKIIDASSKSDITRLVLLQVLMEAEESPNPMFTLSFLEQIIRCYGDSTQAIMSRFMEHSINEFISYQGKLKSPVNSLSGQKNKSSLKTITEHNLENWKKKNKDNQ
ncbi:MAG TPA: polyhydroxyalkanoate synthesis repressor PhaR [Aeromonadales bacterium]|nr:polyhydroxyalkanoate synthesis repressor PhaR [Aeromonadales bacterium]